MYHGQNRRLPLFESFERRILFSFTTATLVDPPAELPLLTVRRPGARASETGPTARAFTIERSGDVTNPLRVAYLIGGKARNGVDYEFIKSWANIGAGKSTVRVYVTPIDDAHQESVEAVTLTLSPRGTYQLGSVFAETIRISDNDGVVEPPAPPPPPPPAPVLPTVDLICETGDATEAGPVAKKVTITRDSADVSADLVVHLALGGTAANGVDYAAIETIAVIPAGAASVDLVVTPIDDSAVEGSETVTLGLSADAAYVLGGATSATITILDNDQLPPPPPPPPPTTTEGVLKWSTAPSVPLGRSEAMSAVINGQFYVLGGFVDYTIVPTDQVHAYDPATRTWSRKADIPWPISHSGVAVDGDYLYLAGGYPANATKTTQLYGTNIVRRYNSVTDTWDTIRSLPQARATGALVLLGRELHWVSGTDITRADRAEHWALNLEDPAATWQTRAPIPTARNHVGHVVYDGKIYIIGGAILQDEAETALKIMEIYDPATDSWSRGPDMPTPRALIQGGVAVHNGKIIVAGGENSFQRATAEVTSFDPATGKWTQLTPLPGKRIAGQLASIGDELYFATGYYNQFNSTMWVGAFV